MQLEIFVSGLGHLLSWLEIPVPRQETAVSLCGNCRISTWKLAFLTGETVVPIRGNWICLRAKQDYIRCCR